MKPLQAGSLAGRNVFRLFFNSSESNQPLKCLLKESFFKNLLKRSCKRIFYVSAVNSYCRRVFKGFNHRSFELLFIKKMLRTAILTQTSVDRFTIFNGCPAYWTIPLHVISSLECGM